MMDLQKYMLNHKKIIKILNNKFYNFKEVKLNIKDKQKPK